MEQSSGELEGQGRLEFNPFQCVCTLKSRRCGGFFINDGNIFITKHI